jgi:hypothetical protein
VTVAAPPGALGALLEHVVDYAGLFPPAALDLPAALAEYDAQRRGPDAWMLGRFVLPATRLAELAASRGPAVGGPWRLSALVGPGEAGLVDAFNEAHAERARVDVVELKAATPDEAEAALAGRPRGTAAYVEVPLDASLEALLDAVQAHGGRAKARTGGVTAAAFPEPSAVARFLDGCVRRSLPFKATAGLHHPVRGEQALTYAPDAPRGVMHGFLNLLAATALLCAGEPFARALQALEERDASAFAVADDGFAWRGARLSATAVRSARALFAGFGSCSFGEPVSDLRALGLLP